MLPHGIRTDSQLFSSLSRSKPTWLRWAVSAWWSLRGGGLPLLFGWRRIAQCRGFEALDVLKVDQALQSLDAAADPPLARKADDFSRCNAQPCGCFTNSDERRAAHCNCTRTISHANNFTRERFFARTCNSAFGYLVTALGYFTRAAHIYGRAHCFANSARFLAKSNPPPQSLRWRAVYVAPTVQNSHAEGRL
jgi:hypothetical protein